MSLLEWFLTAVAVYFIWKLIGLITGLHETSGRILRSPNRRLW